MTSQSRGISVRFHQRPTAQDYALAVLACREALTAAGFGDLAILWSDGTASDEQINELAQARGKLGISQFAAQVRNAAPDSRVWPSQPESRRQGG